MKEQIGKAFTNIKEYWKKLTKKSKTIILATAGTILLLAVGLTVYMNFFAGGYQVLYPGITSTESTQVYATLKSLGYAPQISETEEIMVPKDQVDECLFQLAGKGIRTSKPTYNVFFDNMGFTATEMEKQQALIFQLQDRLQETLCNVKGIENAVVTLNLPKKSNYVWDDQSDESTAGVVITAAGGQTIDAEKVTAIKNLVASSVPKMKAENVTVLDSTGAEPLGTDAASGSDFDYKRLDFERQVAKGIEDQIKRLLTPRYGVGGVTAVASVTLDYDKMVTESKEYTPDANGNGVKSHLDEQYSITGTYPAQGLVGEDPNTDLPSYANQTGSEAGGMTDYQRNIDYETGYILRQIEKGQPILKSASVSVIVDDNVFDTTKEEQLLNLISTATNIPQNMIAVTNLNFSVPGADVATDVMKPTAMDNRRLMILVSAGGLLFLLMLLLVVFLLIRRGHKKQEEVVAQSENVIHDLQAEIEAHKRQLRDSAEAVNNSKENAITNEVRAFAKENPELTATLIRSLLKEGE